MSTAATTPRWGMVVDLNRCVGCQTCTVACKHANDTEPGVQWRRVLDVEVGTYPDVERLFLVVGCQHCADPPCVPVCPSGATRQRADGLVTMDYDVCIGCGYCAVACPYQARTIVHDKRWYFGVETPQERAVAHPERIGVAQKCTFCIERIDEGIELGRKPGEDLDYTPACAAACVASAITFGDFNDPQSKVSRLVAERASFQMHAELGTNPQIRYLYEVPAVPGRDPAPEDMSEETLRDPSNPLAGKLQRFWDFRAAMNFTLGGMSSGLAFLSAAAYFLGGLPERAFLGLATAAGVLMAVGLFFVFLEIGRKLRFLNVLRRPQTSWMTRETYFVALFYPVLALDWLRPAAPLHALVGLAGLGFLVCQARILYAGKGIPAWRVPLIPWMLTATGLLEATGLYALAHALYRDAVPFGAGFAALGMLLAIATGGLWIAYRLTARRNGIPPLARDAINRVAPYVTLLGHAVPLVAFAPLANGIAGPGMAAIGGIGAVLGGVLWKFTVITRASYQQGFALPKIPHRGSGKRAAPPRFGFASLAGRHPN
ncbi:MAG TPA: DmsC/YnfH family molybdoenzyme membrane anchor subunit [Burkholderiales bacterium]